MAPLRRLLYEDTFTNVMARVAFQYIRLAARRNPAPFQHHAPTAILDLANRDRKTLAGGIYWSLVSAAKWHAQGISLHTWRDQLTLADRDRALHKRRPPSRRRTPFY